MARVKVDLVTRADAFTKSGGDVSQLLATADELTALGCDVRTVAFTAGLDVRPGAVVHFFNIDRPFEAIATARLADAAGATFALSTIHHSRQHVRRMRRDDPRTVTARLPERVRALAVYLRQLLRHDGAPWTIRVSAAARSLGSAVVLTGSIRRLLDRADVVFLLGESEAKALRQDFAWSGRKAVLAPNGVSSAMTASAAPRDQIVVLGRIEQRKRQLELVRRADQLAIAITFAGDLNPNQADYGEAFRAEVEASRFSTWLGRIDHAEVNPLLARTAVLINASWVEVQSLVDIEAARAGCFIVNLEDGGASREWLGAIVTEVPADDLDGALQAAVGLAHGMAAPPSCAYLQTWAQTAETLVLSYRAHEGI